MIMVDPISDMLTRIRNAQLAGHKTVIIPLSKIKLEIARILKQEKYVDDYKKMGKGNKKILEVDLKYPLAIKEIKRISKPGQRIYVKASGLKQVKSGYGISIISTPRGLMTNKEAHKVRLGGEVLFEIW
ncbi:MAG: 30S ribosomal protein S8 [Candidatus Azambacteria bacterium]|nr:30S ribosomal protein S8 [Candidatus Azambacteria bacterium]